MVQKGIEGDPRAALLMLTMGQNIEAEKKAEQLELMQLAVDHKKGWTETSPAAKLRASLCRRCSPTLIT